MIYVVNSNKLRKEVWMNVWLFNVGWWCGGYDYEVGVGKCCQFNWDSVCKVVITLS